jgi:hypothetical protein
MHSQTLKLASLRNLLFCLLGTLLLIPLARAQYPVDVNYKKRDHRYEGIKSQPVAGYYIELISALAMPREEVQGMPEKLKLRFFLKELYPVYITVRERDSQHNYWMDRVIPQRPWHLGYNNEFAWPTRDVLNRLTPQIKVNDLAVLARLKKSGPSQIEQVAPVILYSSRAPSAIEGYMFTFRMNVDARLSCSVYKENEATSLIIQNFPREPAGRPFTFIWNSSGMSEGLYRLGIKGKKLSNNENINLTVVFYHQPAIK